MRNYLTNINIVGGISCFREGEHCRITVEWLIKNCNQVIIQLDNWDELTKNIIFDYKNKYPKIVRVIYSNEPIREDKNLIQGQIKKRWKIRQPYIRERVIKEVHKINKENPVNIFTFFDSDELPINQFGEILEEFWNNKSERWIMAGFIEPFENFKTIIQQKMSPHGRVFKYCKELSALPYKTRTRYFPYCNERAWKVRNLILHFCHFDEERRKRRMFFDNVNWFKESMDNCLWQLPKDVREMSVEEIADYQFGAHGTPSKYPPIPLVEYLKNKKYGENIQR